MSWQAKFRRMRELATVRVLPSGYSAFDSSQLLDIVKYVLEVRPIADHRGSFSWEINCQWRFIDKDGREWRGSAKKSEDWIDDALKTLRRNIKTIRATRRPYVVVLFLPKRLCSSKNWPRTDPDYASEDLGM